MHRVIRGNLNVFTAKKYHPNISKIMRVGKSNLKIFNVHCRTVVGGLNSRLISWSPLWSGEVENYVTILLWRWSFPKQGKMCYLPWNMFISLQIIFLIGRWNLDQWLTTLVKLRITCGAKEITISRNSSEKSYLFGWGEKGIQ